MANEKDQDPSPNPSQMTGPHRDRQGNDKAPGEEETEGSLEDVVADTQTGKGKVDGDPTEESDRPVKQS